MIFKALGALLILIGAYKLEKTSESIAEKKE
jgi:hypothetical protein